jgi:hypothetical protein
MTATYNPQAAAAEARANYREVTARLGLLGLYTAIPESVRVLAENAVDRTRDAYDHSTDAFEASFATFEKSFDAAGQGAAAFNRKIIDIARRNVLTRLRPGQEPGRRQKPRSHGGPARGLLAQADRNVDGAS